MKLMNAAFLLLAAWLYFQTGAEAQSTNIIQTALQDRLHEIVAQVQAKAEAGKQDEADFTDELKSFDALIADEKGVKTDEAALISMLKAKLYLDVFRDYVKTAEILEQVSTNYPETENGKRALADLPGIQKMAAAQKIQDSLVVGSEFPDFAATDLHGHPLSVHALTGKVVLVDFWATWCPVCVTELPNLAAAYQKYHKDGFEVIGIDLDHDRDTLDTFLKKQAAMSWPQYFDGRGWTNTIATQYGVEALPFSVLIGPNGKIIARNLRGPEFEMAVAEALALQSK
jgi:thiol-disulfide isomerase/thioredoxin